MSQVTTYLIKPGIRLHHIHTEQFKTLSVSVHFHRPISEQEASNNALLTSVMRRGNASYQDSASLTRYLQSLYGAYFDADVRKKGEDQIVSFVVSTVNDVYLPAGETCVLKVVELLYDMILSPQITNDGFREDYVMQEKTNLINDIRALINDKRSYAVWRLVEHMCAGEPYAVHELGSEAAVCDITPQSLYEHYHKVIFQSPIDIFVTGAGSVEKILELTKERFSGVNPTSSVYPKAELFSGKGSLGRIDEVYDINQAKLSIGFTTGICPCDPRYDALMVYNSIFGGGAHSKLFNHVREKLSLAYYASSRLERYKGIMVVSSGIEYKNKEQAEAEIFAQSEAMAEGDISDYEFDVSVKSIINSLRALSDASGYLADYYLGQAVSGTSISLEEKCRAIAGVTREEVIEVAKEIQPEMVYVMKGHEQEGEN